MGIISIGRVRKTTTCDQVRKVLEGKHNDKNFVLEALPSNENAITASFKVGATLTRNKTDELEVRLNGENERNGIIGLSEHWLLSHESDELAIANYTVSSHFSRARGYGNNIV